MTLGIFYRLYGIHETVSDCSDRFADYDTLEEAREAAEAWQDRGWHTQIFKRDAEGNEDEIF